MSSQKKKAIHYLMSESGLTYAEARAAVEQSPGICDADSVPIPVRITVQEYPSKICKKRHFKDIQSFVLDAVHYRKAAYLLDLVLTGGYVLILTQSEESAQFVRSLIPEMVAAGLVCKEPLGWQIAKYYTNKKYLFTKNRV